MNQTTAIINARLVDPASELDIHGGVLIENDLIAETGSDIDPGLADTVIDAKGCILAPALIDLRTAKEPSLTPDGETLATLAQGAAAGGIGTLVVAPNAITPMDKPESLTGLVRDAAAQPVRILTAGGATAGLSGESIAELGLQARAGAVYVSNGDHPVGNAQTMRRLLAYASHLDLWVSTRPADASLESGCVATESDWSARLGLPAEPAMSERIAIERDASLAELSGGKLMIDRITTETGLDALRHVRGRDIEIAATASIAHLTLNEIDAGDLDGAFRMVPPLRLESDRRALVDAVARGDIDAIVSDHRPTPYDDKAEPFAIAVPGTLAMEILLPALLGLVRDEELSLVQALKPVTSGPADLLNLPQGRIQSGAPADLVLVDGDRPWVCDPANFKSPRGNCAWADRRFQGVVLQTIMGGVTIYNHNA